MVLPIIKAGATFHVNRYSGKFHGVINPTTPAVTSSSNQALSKEHFTVPTGFRDV
jgi:hypothetical protein